jgi:hypothetical protein
MSTLLSPQPVSSRLHAALDAAVPTLSSRARSLIEGMLHNQGTIGCAQRVATQLGFRNRFAFARWLNGQGLPPLHLLAGWIAILSWLDRTERDDAALCAIALGTGRDPAACYRLVQRVTGKSWGTVRVLGLAWALSEFAACCRTARRRWGPAACARSQVYSLRGRDALEMETGMP